MSQQCTFWFVFLASFITTCSSSCDENKCLTLGRGISTKFQAFLAEEGVRIVYFKLQRPWEQANSSTRLSMSHRLIPGTWVWAKSNEEPLLSLSYDYDVLSLSLLKNQARELTLDLTARQNECLRSASATCEDLAIAGALLNVTGDIAQGGVESLGAKTHVVCFRVLEEHWFGFGAEFKYQCCKAVLRDNNNVNSAVIDCSVPVKESAWLAVFNAILLILVIISVLYWPWLFSSLPSLLSPNETRVSVGTNPPGNGQMICMAGPARTQNDEQEDQQQQQQQQQREILLDDFSPIDVQTFLTNFSGLFPQDVLNVRMKLFLLWFGFIPICFYIKLALYAIIKSLSSLDDASRKLLFQVGNHYFFVFDLKTPLVYAAFVVPFFLIPALSILLVPTRINYSSMVKAKDASMGKIGDSLEKIRLISSKVLRSVLSKLSKKNIFGRCNCSRKNPIIFFYTLIYFLIIFPISTLLVFLFFLISSSICLAILSPYIIFLVTTAFSKESSIFHRILFLYSTTSVTLILIFSCQFAVRMMGFVIMGIILNAEFVVPYMTFAFVVSQNIYLCYSSTQNKYKEIKDIIAEKLKVTDTMPEELFWLVCDKVLPISKEILTFFFKVFSIIVFLSIALTAILLFNVTYGASAVVQTISVFISGKFSEIFFTGVTQAANFSGWEKIQLDEDITSLVEEYVAEMYLSRYKNEANVP